MSLTRCDAYSMCVCGKGLALRAVTCSLSLGKEAWSKVRESDTCQINAAETYNELIHNHAASHEQTLHFGHVFGARFRHWQTTCHYRPQLVAQVVVVGGKVD